MGCFVLRKWKETTLPRGFALSKEQCREIYEAHKLGEKRKDIAEAYGIACSTVSKIVKQQREQQEKENLMASREKVVAGNRKDGRLISLNEINRYEGTCVVAGRAHSKAFTADTVNAAIELWQKWCNELRTKKTVAQREPERKEPSVQQATKEVAKPTTTVKLGNEEIYIIWAKGDNPRLYGAYRDMDSALSEVERANEVASFLLHDRIFEIEGVTLKS